MRFVGTVYRALDPRWQHEPLSGAGAAIRGGRFNPPGMPALYTALTAEGTLRETQRIGAFQPITLVAFDAEVDDVLDSRDAVAMAGLGVSDADMTPGPWLGVDPSAGPPPGQALARRLYAAGVAGLIVRSFARGARADDMNLILWRWGRDLPHRLWLVDDDRRLGPTPRPRA
jgi:RES domain-containing protein